MSDYDENKDPEYVVYPEYGTFRAKCSFCNWTCEFKELSSCGLQVGSAVFTSTDNERSGKCGRCQRISLVVTHVPEPPIVEVPRVGFTKIPTV